MQMLRASMLAVLWQAVASTAANFDNADRALSLYESRGYDAISLAASFNNGTLYSGNNLTQVQQTSTWLAVLDLAWQTEMHQAAHILPLATAGSEAVLNG